MKFTTHFIDENSVFMVHCIFAHAFNSMLESSSTCNGNKNSDDVTKMVNAPKRHFIFSFNLNQFDLSFWSSRENIL